MSGNQPPRLRYNHVSKTIRGLWAPPLALGDTDADPGPGAKGSLSCTARCQMELSARPNQSHSQSFSFPPGPILPKKGEMYVELKRILSLIPLQILLGIGLLRRSMKLQVMCSKIT